MRWRLCPGVIEELEARREPALHTLGLTPLYFKINILGITESSLRMSPLLFEEPFLRKLDTIHEVDDVLARGGANILNQRFVIGQMILIDAAPVACLVKQVDELLRMNFDEI